MIVVSEDRYLPTMPGYMVLQDDDGVYYYVYKTLYEQAVILKDRYGSQLDVLKELIGGNQNNVAITKFTQYVPEPVSIMGYFLALLDKDTESFEEAVGALDAIASTVNLRELVKQPLAIRQEVSFGQSITNQYKDTWAHFIDTCVPYDGTPVHTSTPSPAQEAPIGGLDFDTLFAPSGLPPVSFAGDTVATVPDPVPTPAPVPETPSSLGGDGLSTIAKAKRRAL